MNGDPKPTLDVLLHGIDLLIAKITRKQRVAKTIGWIGWGVAATFLVYHLITIYSSVPLWEEIFKPRKDVATFTQILFIFLVMILSSGVDHMADVFLDRTKDLRSIRGILVETIKQLQTHKAEEVLSRKKADWINEKLAELHQRQ